MTDILQPQVATDEGLAHVRDMFDKDVCTAMMGISFSEISVDSATATMPIRPDMCNGFDTAQGGMLFTFADSVFAAVCNAPGVMAVAAQCSIHFVRPAMKGEVITAQASLRESFGKNGIVDVRLVNPAGKTVAEFRGTFRQVAPR